MGRHVIQGLPNRFGLRLEEPPVHVPRPLEGQLPGHQRGEAEVAVQKKTVHRPFRRGGVPFLQKARLRLLQEGQPPHRGRGLVIQSRQYLPRRGEIRVYPAEAVDDPALFIQ